MGQSRYFTQCSGVYGPARSYTIYFLQVTASLYKRPPSTYFLRVSFSEDEKGKLMECMEPSEHVDEDISAENIGYCELYPECCETISPDEAIQRPRWWTRLLRVVFPGRDQ
jgi:hypothetical protein